MISRIKLAKPVAPVRFGVEDHRKPKGKQDSYGVSRRSNPDVRDTFYTDPDAGYAEILHQNRVRPVDAQDQEMISGKFSARARRKSASYPWDECG